MRQSAQYDEIAGSRNPSRILSICYQTNFQETRPCKSLQSCRSCDKGVVQLGLSRLSASSNGPKRARAAARRRCELFPLSKEPEARWMPAQNRRATPTLLRSMQPLNYVIRLAPISGCEWRKCGCLDKGKCLCCSSPEQKVRLSPFFPDCARSTWVYLVLSLPFATPKAETDQSDSQPLRF